MNNDRRRILVQGGTTLASLAIARSGFAAAPAEPDVHIELRAARGEVSLRPGKPTDVWRYMGRLLKGEPAVLQSLAATWGRPSACVAASAWGSTC